MHASSGSEAQRLSYSAPRRAAVIVSTLLSPRLSVPLREAARLPNPDAGATVFTTTVIVWGTCRRAVALFVSGSTCCFSSPAFDDGGHEAATSTWRGFPSSSREWLALSGCSSCCSWSLSFSSSGDPFSPPPTENTPCAARAWSVSISCSGAGGGDS